MVCYGNRVKVTRQQRIGVRLTAHEKKRLEKMAASKFVKAGSYARQAILEKLKCDEALAAATAAASPRSR